MPKYPATYQTGELRHLAVVVTRILSPFPFVFGFPSLVVATFDRREEDSQLVSGQTVHGVAETNQYQVGLVVVHASHQLTNLKLTQCPSDPVLSRVGLAIIALTVF